MSVKSFHSIVDYLNAVAVDSKKWIITLYWSILVRLTM